MPTKNGPYMDPNVRALEAVVCEETPYLLVGRAGIEPATP